MKEIAHELASRTMTTKVQRHTHIFHKHAAKLVKRNPACFSESILDCMPGKVRQHKNEKYNMIYRVYNTEQIDMTLIR